MPILHIAIALVLIGVNAFFALAEYSLVRIRPSRVEEMGRQGKRLAGLIRFGLEHLNDYLSAVQFGITMTSLGLGWVGEPGVAELLKRLLPLISLELSATVLSSLSFVLAFLIITVFHITFGELLPKLLAIRTPERSVKITIVPLTVMYYVAFAPMLLLNRTAGALARLLSPHPPEAEGTHSEEEIKILLAQREETGSLSLQNLVMFENLFDFGHSTVREVMTPRSSIAYLSAARTADENIATMNQRKASRYPVCKTDLDTVTGYVHLKDLPWDRNGLTGPELLGRGRPVVRVRESLALEECLHLFQERRVSLALVTDGHKKVTGLLTTEDIVEEIVGEIRDEFERPQVYRLTEALVPEASEFSSPDTELLPILRNAVARLHAARPSFNQATALELLHRREQGLSSAVGYGAAFPHARIERLDKPLIGYTRCPQGVDLRSIDGKPVRMVFVILTPYHEPTAQLGLVSKLARLILNPTLRDRLCEAETQEDLVEVLRAFEDTVPV